MQVVVLGRVGIVRHGVHCGVGRGQARAVLAFLAINVGESVSADALVRALWADLEPATARAQVQNVVSAIRRVFAEIGAPQAIDSGRYGYRLAIPATAVDLGQFEALTRSARELSVRDAPRAAEQLRLALALWRGEPLADATGAFVESARVGIEERRLLAVEKLAELELSQLNAATVVTDLLPYVEGHPFRESLRRLLMVALQQSGRHAEALRSYRSYRDLLADREGLDPGPHLTRLATELLRGADGAGSGDPPDERAVSGGAVVPAIPPPIGEVREDRVAPAQLPADVEDYVGRRGYLDELGIIAASSLRGARVVVVSGMAGVGKTSLVVHWAHTVRDQFPAGQLFVDLRGFGEGEPLPPIVALARFLRALGTPPESIPTDVDDAAAMYRTVLAGRRLLIVLDNASHADQVRPLLPGAAGCVVAVTSRHSLSGLVARDNARRIFLDVLAPAESEQLLGLLMPDLGGETYKGDAASLAVACGHIPLALRIAAAKLAEPGDIADAKTAPAIEDMDEAQRLAFMQVEGDRLASMLAAFDFSYATLPIDMQRLFRTLGHIVGADFSSEQASALAGLTDADHRLADLVQCSLIRQVGPDRYAMHDLVRAYARTLSAHDPVEHQTESTGRMYRWYLDRLAAAAAALYPQTLRVPPPTNDDMGVGHSPEPAELRFADGPAALAWLDAELPNLVAIVTYTAQHGPRETAARIADGLRGYFWIRRYVTEWLTIAQAGVEAAEAERYLPGLVMNHISLGAAYRCLSRFADSVTEFNHALETCPRIPWLEAEATVLSQLAMTFADHGRLAQARDRFLDALAVNRRLGRTGSEAVTLGNLGTLRIRSGELAESCRDYAGATELYRQVGSLGGVAISQTNLGVSCFYLGRFDEAWRHFSAGLDLHREIGDRYGQALALFGIAYLRSEQGRHHEAIEFATESLSIARETGDRQCEAYALITLGHIRLGLGAPQQAAAYYVQGWGVAHAAEERLPETEALIGHAQAHLALGDIEAAYQTVARANQQAKDLSFHLLGGQALTLTAAVHLAAGRHADARACAELALKRHQETGHLPGEARTHWILGQIAQAGDRDATAAIAAFDLARAQFAKIGMVPSAGL